MHLHWIDYSIMLIYVGFVVGIGFALKRYMKTSADFFLSGRSIPAWVCGLAFLSANLGALELVGMAASGAKYGIATCPLLLARGDPRDDLPRRLHDAVLLRLQGRAPCPNISSSASTNAPAPSTR